MDSHTRNGNKRKKERNIRAVLICCVLFSKNVCSHNHFFIFFLNIKNIKGSWTFSRHHRSIYFFLEPSWVFCTKYSYIHTDTQFCIRCAQRWERDERISCTVKMDAVFECGGEKICYCSFALQLKQISCKVAS